MKKLTARQVAALSPEARERYEKKLKTVKRNRRILTGIIAAVAVAAVFAVLSVTVLFNVSEIKVAKAGTHYNAEQILDAAGVEVGDNMIMTNWDKVKSKAEEKLPYILSLEIKKSIGGKVTFTVKDDKAALLFKTADGYAIADSNGKTLEVMKNKPKNSGLMILTVKNQIHAKPGETITFADENEKTLYDNICAAIKGADMKNITGIDISDSKNIYLEYQSRYRLYLGDDSDIEYKLKEAKKVIAQEDENNPKQIGEINLSIPKKVYVEPLETLEKTTAAAAKPAAAEEKTTQAEEETTQSDESDSEENTTEPEEKTEPEEENTTAEDTAEEE